MTAKVKKKIVCKIFVVAIIYLYPFCRRKPKERITEDIVRNLQWIKYVVGKYLAGEKFVSDRTKMF